MTYQEFVDKYNNKGIDFDLPGAMNLGMFRSRKYYKIFWSIVVLNMVDVMNNFIRPKESTQNFLHDQAMFSNMAVTCSRMMRLIKENVFALMSNSALPVIMISSSIKRSSTWIRTKTLDLISPVFKSFMTKIAISELFPGIIVTISVTKPSFLTWRGLKFVFTNFANIYHSGSICQTMQGVNI